MDKIVGVSIEDHPMKRLVPCLGALLLISQAAAYADLAPFPSHRYRPKDESPEEQPAPAPKEEGKTKKSDADKGKKDTPKEKKSDDKKSEKSKSK